MGSSRKSPRPGTGAGRIRSVASIPAGALILTMEDALRYHSQWTSSDREVLKAAQPRRQIKGSVVSMGAVPVPWTETEERQEPRSRMVQPPIDTS